MLSMSFFLSYGMEPLQDPTTQEQLSLARSDYHQKWIASQSSSELLEPGIQSQPPVEMPIIQLSAEENIVNLFLHRFDAYKKTYGCLPPEIKQLLAQHILKTIPTLNSIIQKPATPPILSQIICPYPAYQENPKFMDHSPMLCGCFNASKNKIAYATKEGLHILEIFLKNDAYQIKKQIHKWHGMSGATVLEARFINDDAYIMLIDDRGRGRAFSCTNKDIFEVKNSEKFCKENLEVKAIKKQIIDCMNLKCTDALCTKDNRIHNLKNSLKYKDQELEFLDFQYNEESDLIHLMAHEANSYKKFPQEPTLVLTCYLSKMKWITIAQTQAPDNELSTAMATDATGNILFYQSFWREGVKYHIRDFSSQVERDSFIHNIDIDNALCLAILFQLKKQKGRIDAKKFPQLTEQISRLPGYILSQFDSVIEDHTKDSCLIL